MSHSPGRKPVRQTLRPKLEQLENRLVPCASPRPEWIWCDDFEANRLSRYFEYDNNGGDFVRVAGVGSAAARACGCGSSPGRSTREA